VNETVDPDSTIGVRARAWALAVSGESFPPERSEALRAWLDADVRHKTAYEHAEATLLMLDRVEGLRAATATRRPRPRRIWAWTGAGGALAACLAGAAWLIIPPPAIESGSSQTLRVNLADGSVVSLAPGSSLRAASRLTARSPTLLRGEAFFTVAHRSGAPFTVGAGETSVHVVGTRFDVHRSTEGRVRVQVEEGVVEVSPRSSAPLSRLVAGQQAVLEDGTTRIAALTGEKAGSWRTGQLSYVSAPLADVVEDLNRYRQTPLRVASPAVGDLKVTAGFPIDQADHFLASLPKVLPVRLTRDVKGVVVISDVRSGSRAIAP
jgi:transmembrane sensor